MLASTYHGVDFSGATDPRRKMRVATLVEGEPVRVADCATHAQLVARIAAGAQEAGRHFWLIDAPFALPRELLDAHGVTPAWRPMVEWLASFDSPRDWRRACRAVSRREPRRDVDRRARTPLPPTNLRMFKQTWHAIVSVLLPLADTESVAILPMAVADPSGAPARLDRARVWIGEGCPASTLRSLGWPSAGYKGPSIRHRDMRRELLARLERDERVPVSETAARAAVDDPEGDALDSVVLIAAARRLATCDHRSIALDDPRAALEGWVYT